MAKVAAITSCVYTNDVTTVKRNWFLFDNLTQYRSTKARQFAKFHSHKTVALETDICYVVGDDDPDVDWDPFFITFSGLPTRISGSIEISAPTRCLIPRAKRQYCGKKNPLKAKRRGRTSIDRDRKIEIRKDKFKSVFFAPTDVSCVSSKTDVSCVSSKTDVACVSSKWF